MSEEITFNENKLVLPSKTIPFKYRIEQILETNLRVFVLLDIPDSVVDCENIYALTKSGDLVWIVQHVNRFNPKVTKFSSYVGMRLLPNGNISATNFFGMTYEISGKNGMLLSAKMSK